MDKSTSHTRHVLATIRWITTLPGIPSASLAEDFDVALIVIGKVNRIYICFHDLAGMLHNHTQWAIQIRCRIHFADDPGKCFKPVAAPGFLRVHGGESVA
jgi:hypothetical protein